MQTIIAFYDPYMECCRMYEPEDPGVTCCYTDDPVGMAQSRAIILGEDIHLVVVDQGKDLICTPPFDWEGDSNNG